jgi:predicted ester cyclase
MPIEKNKAFIRRYFQALCATEDKSPARFDQFVAEEALKQHLTIFEAIFPGYQLNAEDLVAEGDKVIVRASMTDTHPNELMGVPLTGQQVKVSLMLIYRSGEGKIVEHWMNADTLGLLQQLQQFAKLVVCL